MPSFAVVYLLCHRFNRISASTRRLSKAVFIWRSLSACGSFSSDDSLKNVVSGRLSRIVWNASLRLGPSSACTRFNKRFSVSSSGTIFSLSSSPRLLNWPTCSSNFGSRATSSSIAATLPCASISFCLFSPNFWSAWWMLASLSCWPDSRKRLNNWRWLLLSWAIS